MISFNVAIQKMNGVKTLWPDITADVHSKENKKGGCEKSIAHKKERTKSVDSRFFLFCVKINL
jgi:hypothetical protein